MRTIEHYRGLVIEHRQPDGEDWFRDAYFVNDGDVIVADAVETVEEARELIDAYMDSLGYVHL